MLADTGTSNRYSAPRSLTGKILAFAASLDKLQLGMALFLCCVGLIFIHSTGVQAGRGAASFWRQLFWLGVGWSVYLLCSLPDPRKVQFKISSSVLYPVSMLLLALLLIPHVGVRAGGACRWLGVGSLRIQPSEFAKLGLILALSVLFSGFDFKVNSFSGIALSVMLTLLPFLLIVVEPDLGSAMVCLPICLAILFCGGLSWRSIVIGAVAVALIGGLVVLNETVGSRPLLTKYQRARINTFLDPEYDRAGAGFNAHQARLAVGSGGLTGKGIGEGTQNTLGFLPRSVANNDFIFSVIAEETGFFGSMALLCGYILLIYSVMRTAFLASDAFCRSLCVGVATLFFTHMFINIGMSVGIMPVTGLPLPLVSRGGSFTVVALASLGLVQAVHRHREA